MENYAKVAMSSKRIINHSDIIQKKETQLNNQLPLSNRYGHIELHLTDLCNLSCAHCHFRNEGNTSLELNWINIIVDEMKPKAISLVGGGEPTCYPYFQDAIKIISSSKADIKIGMITNGVIIPEGDWHKNLSWIRISLYEIDNSSYCGTNSKIKKQVISNYFEYLNNTDIPKVGISILLHKSSIKTCFNSVLQIYNEGKNYLGDNRLNLQFKLAFSEIRPSKITNDLHQENINFLASEEELIYLVKKLDSYAESNFSFSSFLNNKTNFCDIKTSLISKAIELKNSTDPQLPIDQNFKKCYYTLAFALITATGYIYPCPTIGEFRDKSLSYSHISSFPESIEKLKFYYQAKSECCNKRFCRYANHNKHIARFKQNEIKKLNNSINEDPFF